MAQNTINDLLTKSLSQLAEIEDSISPVAGDQYVQDKIMNPMKSMATSIFSNTGYKFLNSLTGDPNYNNLQTLLNSNVGGTAFGTSLTLAVLVQKQLADGAMTISINRTNTIISSLTKENFYIILGVNVSQMIFRNIEVKINNGVVLTNCIFDNCKITSTGTFSISNTKISDTFINTATLEILDLCELYSNRIRTSNSLVFNIAHTNSKMLNCYTSKIPTNESNNLTMEFNTYAANL